MPGIFSRCFAACWKPNEAKTFCVSRITFENPQMEVMNPSSMLIRPVRPVRDAGGMLTQAEEGMKLFAAQNGAAAEIDKAAAEAYKADIEARTSDSFSALSPGFGH